MVILKESCFDLLTARGLFTMKEPAVKGELSAYFIIAVFGGGMYYVQGEGASWSAGDYPG